MSKTIKKAPASPKTPKVQKSKSKPSTKEGVGKISVEVDKDSTVSARKIENGFIISESGSNGTGKNYKYYNREYFSKENPIKLTGFSTGVKQPKFGKR